MERPGTSRHRCADRQKIYRILREYYNAVGYGLDMSFLSKIDGQ